MGLPFSVGITSRIILSMREKGSGEEHQFEGDDTTFRDLVTVRTFFNPSEAMLAKALLDSAGIDCFLADDNAARVMGGNIPGVRAQVSRVDAEAAKALLDQPIPGDNAQDSC